MAILGKTKVLQFGVRDRRKITEAITRKAQETLNKKLQGLVSEIENIVDHLIRESMSVHPVIGALLGDNAGAQDGSDLPAEFGLTQSDASAGVRAIRNHLLSENNINVEIATNKTARSTQVFVVTNWLSDSTIDAIAKDPAGSYISEGNTQGAFEVPWMEWMLLRATDNVLIPDWGIVYDLTRDESRSSRSGRALMVSSIYNLYQHPEAVFPYIVPRICVPLKGQNWIEESLTSYQFRSLANRTIEKAIRKRLGLVVPSGLYGRIQ